jgi:hypothetical protein
MHRKDWHDCLTAVITAQEAATLWGLSRNTVSDACRRGALRGRKSGRIWLVTIIDMLVYQNGRYRPEMIPAEMKPALEQAVTSLKDTE